MRNGGPFLHLVELPSVCGNRNAHRAKSCSEMPQPFDIAASSRQVDAISSKTSRAAERVVSMSSALCATETKLASNWLHGK